MSAIELDAYLKKMRLNPTWSLGARRIFDEKRVEEAITRELESSDLARRQTRAAERQALSANWALVISILALVVAIVGAVFQGLPLFR